MTNANTHPSPTRPNYFILLGLNPDEAWNEEKFKSLLHEKQNEWSRLQMSVGQKALIAKQNLKLIDDIKAVMMDEQGRLKEAAAARSLLAAKGKARVAEFENHLAFINAKDSIEGTELEKFIKDFQDVYPAERIKEQIKVPIVSSTSPDTVNRQVLEATIAKNITNLLSVINKSSLYDLLGLPDATGTQELCQGAEELYKNEVQRMPKTAEVEARVELAGIAKTIFQTEVMRKQYDENLRRASLDLLLADLDAIMNRVSSKELQAGQVNLFLENAQQAGWKREEAYVQLVEHARQRKWFLPPSQVEARIRCGKCKWMNDRERKLCSECGAELYVDCPNCGRQVSNEDRVCDNCGFVVGNRYLVDKRLDELQSLLNAGDFEKAYGILRMIEEVWRPKYPDDRLKRINEYKDRLERHEQQQKQAQKEKEEQLLVLMSERKFFAAREFLDKYAVNIAHEEVHRRVIIENINRAQTLEKNLQRTMHNLNQDDRIRRVRHIESICKDLPSLGKLRIPPSPPSNLQAKVTQGTQRMVVSLSWNPSSTPDVFYTIVRKSHTPPTSISDGQELSDYPEVCTYDDTAPSPVGVPLYYAVYSGYSSIRSQQAAVLARPVLVTQGVLQTTVQVSDQLVHLSWETPPNVYSVVVVRKEETPPTAITDGLRIGEYFPAKKSMADRHVQNGQTYHYALYCQFKDQDGRLLLSSAQYISATPDTPPRFIHELDITHKPLNQGFEVTIRWQLPDKGDVVIMKTNKPFSVSAGKEIPQRDLVLHGEKLGPQPAPIVEEWANAGTAYYTMAVLYQGMAYIGTSQPYTCRESITDVKSQNLGDRIRFHWKWPINCQEVEVAYSLEDYPTRDPNTMKERVTRAHYERPGRGYFDLQGTADQEYYIIISALFTENGTQVRSEGFRDKIRQASLLKLRYEIRQATLLHRRRTLHITTNRPVTLPQMRLVGKRGKLPSEKSDGELIQSLEPRLIKRNELVVDLPERVYQPETFVRLFLEDDTMYDWVEIINPERDKLRLS